MSREPLDTLSDEELIQRSRQAVESALAAPFLDELLSRHRRRVALWCFRYAGNREDAADLTQEVLTRAWTRLDSFQGESRFTTWLYTLCRNHCLNWARSRAAGPAPQTDETFAFVADLSARDPGESIDLERKRELARGWMRDLLDETERRVLALHFGEEIPLAAVTRMLGLDNASGAKAFVVSARRKLDAAVRKWRVSSDAGRKSRPDA